jgi:hypothetical protein
MDLHALSKSGKISDLKEQVPFILVPKDGKQRAMKYIADFTFIEDEDFVVMDAKGHQTQLYKLKKRLMKYLHELEIREV